MITFDIALKNSFIWAKNDFPLFKYFHFCISNETLNFKIHDINVNILLASCKLNQFFDLVICDSGDITKSAHHHIW